MQTGQIRSLFHYRGGEKKEFDEKCKVHIIRLMLE